MSLVRGRRIVAALAALSLVGVVAAAAVWPSTSPTLIRAKAMVLGPRWVYRPLVADDDRWAEVLQGVRSGDLAWLHAAVALQPALDTHPGEEMLEAIVTVLDVNPSGAVSVLLPVYGVSLVCAQDEDGAPLGEARAGQRRQLLDGLRNAADVNVAACRAAISHLVGARAPRS